MQNEQSAASLEAEILFGKLSYPKRQVKPCFKGKLDIHLKLIPQNSLFCPKKK